MGLGLGIAGPACLTVSLVQELLSKLPAPVLISRGSDAGLIVLRVILYFAHDDKSIFVTLIPVTVELQSVGSGTGAST